MMWKSRKRVENDVEIIRWITGTHQKSFIISSEFPVQKNLVEAGIWSLKIPYRPHEEKIVCDHKDCGMQLRIIGY